MEGCNSETTLVADHGSIAPRGLSGCPLYAERQELQTMNRILVWRKRKTSAESATRLNKRLPSLWIAPIPEVFWRGSLNAHAIFDIIPSEWWQFTGVAITSCKKIRESRRVFRTRKFFFQGAGRKKRKKSLCNQNVSFTARSSGRILLFLSRCYFPPFSVREACAFRHREAYLTPLPPEKPRYHFSPLHLGAIWLAPSMMARGWGGCTAVFLYKFPPGCRVDSFMIQFARYFLCQKWANNFQAMFLLMHVFFCMENDCENILS